MNVIYLILLRGNTELFYYYIFNIYKNILSKKNRDYFFHIIEILN